VQQPSPNRRPSTHGGCDERIRKTQSSHAVSVARWCSRPALSPIQPAAGLGSFKVDVRVLDCPTPSDHQASVVTSKRSHSTTTDTTSRRAPDAEQSLPPLSRNPIEDFARVRASHVTSESYKFAPRAVQVWRFVKGRSQCGVVRASRHVRQFPDGTTNARSGPFFAGRRPGPVGALEREAAHDRAQMTDAKWLF
jgi:hypothetical protein